MLYMCHVMHTQGIGCDEVEEACEAEEAEMEPCRKRMRMHSSLELVRISANTKHTQIVFHFLQMKLRIQSSSSDQDLNSTTPVRTYLLYIYCKPPESCIQRDCVL